MKANYKGQEKRRQPWPKNRNEHSVNSVPLVVKKIAYERDADEGLSHGANFAVKAKSLQQSS